MPRSTTPPSPTNPPALLLLPHVRPVTHNSHNHNHNHNRKRTSPSPSSNHSPTTQTPSSRPTPARLHSYRRPGARGKGKDALLQGLENYQLLEKMGDGAFSNVYKALDLKSGKKIAVKVV
ncbi:hypothetical protein BDQ17DRAFT_1349153, partial [Cyathus striatus]